MRDRHRLVTMNISVSTTDEERFQGLGVFKRVTRW